MDYRPLIPRRALSVQALYSVHYFEYTSTYAFAGERHDFWEFVYVDSGELLVTAGESSRRLRQGQLIFHAPGEFHALSSAGAAPELVVVSFRCAGEAMDRFRGLVTALGPAERALLARIVAESGAAFSTPLGDPSTRALQRRETVPFGAEQLVCCALEELLIRLVRRETAPRPPQRQLRGDGGTAAQVMDYLAAHVGEALTLERICQDNLVGRSQLQKLFHDRTGGGVMAYFNQLKIQEARRMIRSGRLNFTQIAARLGFQSVHYFSRRFRLSTGMSPSEYERSVRMLSEAEPDDCANNG